VSDLFDFEERLARYRPRPASSQLRERIAKSLRRQQRHRRMLAAATAVAAAAAAVISVLFFPSPPPVGPEDQETLGRAIQRRESPVLPDFRFRIEPSITAMGPAVDGADGPIVPSPAIAGATSDTSASAEYPNPPWVGEIEFGMKLTASGAIVADPLDPRALQRDM